MPRLTPERTAEADAIAHFYPAVERDINRNLIMSARVLDLLDAIDERIEVERRTVATLTARAEQADRLEKDCKLLREMLAFAASGFTHLYTDDGELHDASERPHIDYRRDTVEQIQEAIRQRNQQRFSNPTPDEASALSQAEKDRDALAWSVRAFVAVHPQWVLTDASAAALQRAKGGAA